MRSIKEIFKIGFGPSSSHTIGPSRASRMFLERNQNAAKFRVSLYSSLAATGKGHNTDQAIEKSLEGRKVEILWKDNESLPKHPNGMRFEAFNEAEERIDDWKVYSIGGGDLIDDDNRCAVEESIYPVKNMAEALKWCHDNGRHLWELVEIYEGKEIWAYLADIWKIMQTTIQSGLENEGVLPGTLHVARKAAAYYTKAKIATGVLKDKGMIFAMALATAEENANGGEVVTAPTCGASGVLPAALYFNKMNMDQSDARILRALAIAGLIGNITKTNGSISGAEVGCQGEIGTACAMAAGATAYLIGGSPPQVEYAAEMGIEHFLGLTCDPIQGYVQIPCIERNAMAADTARECAVYAFFSDGAHKISFDQVVKTMVETGRDMQAAYRETGWGGLARTWDPLNI